VEKEQNTKRVRIATRTAR